MGHYYYSLLIIQPERRQAFVDLFGDPDADYQQALDRHYRQGAPEGWHECYVSAYATMHAAEDWAETFAHYLHIRDTTGHGRGLRFCRARRRFQPFR